jgi:ketosteroid isomerase-like protein
MSVENVEAARRGFEALDSGGVEAFLDFIDPQFEMTTPADMTVEPATYRGHEGMRRYFDSFYEIMDEVRFEPHEFIDAGDRVVVPARLVARGRDTGIEAVQQLTMVWTLRGGKAIGCETYATKDEALEAAGAAANSRNLR